MTGAEAIVAALAELGVRVVFGLPGVHNLALWDALDRSDIRLVGVRHEQAAVYAADGLARTTGGLGVALTTTGPGAANAVAATGEAHACGSPVLVIATDIPSTLRRPGVNRGALHETSDQAALFGPVIRRAILSEGALGHEVRDAAAEATTAPSGPVYVEVPTDLLAAEEDPPRPWTRPAHLDPTARGEVLVPAPTKGSDLAFEHDARNQDLTPFLVGAERPLVWAGAGARGADVAGLAERIGAPVIETYGARGIVPPSSSSWVGLPPQLPEVGALWDAADLVVAVGTDFDGMNTQNWLQPAPPRLVAINVDAWDASKNYVPDAVLGQDAAAALADLEVPAGAPWADLGAIRSAVRARLQASDPEAVAFLDALATGVDDDVAVFADMCIPGYWVAGMHPFARPRRLAYPVGWGTLGFAFPASIGAALAGERTLAITGDGGFMFALGELATVVQERPPLTILVNDDGGYGMLRYDQDVAGRPHVGVDLHTPDWLALAASFGLRAERVTDLATQLREHLADPEPSLLVTEMHLRPPETTSPRWYRKKAS